VLGLRFEDFGALAGTSAGGSSVGALSDDAVQAARAAAASGSVEFALDEVVHRGRLVAESVHATTATTIASFGSGPQEGSPALTRHAYGAGQAWYTATQPVGAGLGAVVDAVVAASGVRPVVEGLPSGVEAARRGDLVTLINHGDTRAEAAIDGVDAETGLAAGLVVLEPQGVAFVVSPERSAAPAAAAATTPDIVLLP
jgi:beta-galactosidase